MSPAAPPGSPAAPGKFPACEITDLAILYLAGAGFGTAAPNFNSEI